MGLADGGTGTKEVRLSTTFIAPGREEIVRQIPTSFRPHPPPVRLRAYVRQRSRIARGPSMPTKALAGKSRHIPEVTYDRAERLFDRAVDDPELCPVCFDRQRRLFPEEAEWEANELRWGATKITLEAKGHRIRRDGSLQVNVAVSDRDPAMDFETVPPTTIDGVWHPPRAKTICTCGVIDIDRRDCRSLPLLYDCVDHLAEWLDRLELSMYPDEFDVEEAKRVVGHLRRYDSMSGQDKLVLTEALRRGLSVCQ